MKGKLYLIPSPLGEYDPSLVLPAPVLEKARELTTFVVEEVRTARRFLSKAGLKGHIDALEFHTLNEHTTPAEVEALAPLFDKGDVGLISEAGLPAVADPGASEKYCGASRSERGGALERGWGCCRFLVYLRS